MLTNSALLKFFICEKGIKDCKCLPGSDGLNVCMDPNKIQSAIKDCPICESDEECDGEDTCREVAFGKGACKSCIDRIQSALESCNPKCVETEWLLENGFKEGILKESGVSHTFCLPDLPCGTAGHLLRECDEKNTCKFVTYEEMCKKVSGCYSKITEVSRLKASFDWSVVKSNVYSNNRRSVSLTSLSIDLKGEKYLSSIFIAHLGDKMISYGQGRVVDALVTTWENLERFRISAGKSMISCTGKRWS